MQMRTPFLIASLTVVLFCLIFNSSCSSGFSDRVLAQTQSNRLSPNVNGSEQADTAPEYDVLLGRECLKKRRCFAYLVVEKELITKSRLIALVKHLKAMNKKRELVRIAIFDDAAVANDYLNGRREIREIDNDIKGLYFLDSKGEILKAKLGNSAQFEVVLQNGQIEGWITETR